MSGVDLIAKERWRQEAEEGYDSAHDDARNTDFELTMAAVCYASAAAHKPVFVEKELGQFRDPWPWFAIHDKRPSFIGANSPGTHPRLWLRRPSDEECLRLLVQAGALIAAEIDRLLRIKTG